MGFWWILPILPYIIKHSQLLKGKEKTTKKQNGTYADVQQRTPPKTQQKTQLRTQICICLRSFNVSATFPQVFPSKSAFCSQFVSAYGPKTGPAFLRFFLHYDMLGAGGGWRGCNNVLCLRYHRFFSANTLHVTLHTSVLGRGWVEGAVITSCVYVIIDFLRRTHSMLGVQQHPVSMLSSIFFGEPLHVTLHTSVFFWRGVGWGGATTSCVYVIIDFLRRTHSMLRCTLLFF